MGGSEPEAKEGESSNSVNWDKAFNLYANVIASENDALKTMATIKLAKMSRNAPENTLELTVPILLKLLECSNESVQEACAYALKCIASRGEGRLANLIGQSGAIPILLRLLLNNSEEGLQRAILKCLRNVVTFWVPNRVNLATNGGPETVISMLRSCSDDTKLILLEILSVLALIREVRKFIWNSRSVCYLVEAAKFGSLISRTRAAHAIALLGSIKKAQRLLLDEGSANALVNLFRDGDLPTKLVAGNALGVISSHVDHIRPVAQAGVIPLYFELLEGSDPIGKEIAEDVLCVLAVNEENAIIIIDHLVRILRGGDIGAKAKAADVIWDLSSYNYTLPIVKNSGVISILVELLKDESVEVKENAAGAVAQLSGNEDDRTVLVDCGAIPVLVDVLRDESDELRDNAAEALVNFSMDPLLRDHVSCVLDDPFFQNMRDRVMQIRASDAHMDASLRHIGTDQLAWDSGLL